MLLTQAIILDLLARYRTGKGQYVETSLSDEMMYMQARPAPLLGDDSARVLRDNRYSDAEVEVLLTEGIIA